MNDARSGGGCLSDIGYEDSMLLIGHLSSGADHRDDSSRSLSTVHGELERVCGRIRKELFREARQRGRLFEPRTFVTFGKTDYLSLIPIDSTDRLTLLTANRSLPINQCTLAFCPRIQDVAAPHRSGPREPPSALCSVTDLLFCEDPLPLMAFSYLKLSPLATLGLGIAFQNALLRAIDARIDRTLEYLRSNAAERRDLDIDVKELERVRVSLVEPEGWPDLALLARGLNYSTLCSILAVLRGLTFHEVFTIDASLKESIRRSRVVDWLARSLVDREGANADSIAENHVFSTSNTTLGVAHRDWRQPAADGAEPAAGRGGRHSLRQIIQESDGVGGLVRPKVGVRVFPGHDATAHDIVARIVQEREPGRWPDREPDAPTEQSRLQQIFRRARRIVDWRPWSSRSRRTLPVAPGSLYWFTVGETDYELHWMLHGPGESGISETASLPELIAHLAEETNSGDVDSLSDLITELSVPVSRNLLKELTPDVTSAARHLPVPKALERCRSRLFGPGGRLDHARLNAHLKQLGVPVPLCSSVMYLYHDFANCLGNSLLVDQVIDLYDYFVGFYRGLERDAKRSQANPPRWGSAYSRYTLSQIERSVETLQNALAHRVKNKFRDIERWDLGVDFRGGLNKLVHGADGHLKCTLGFVKTWDEALGRSASPGASASSRPAASSAGALTRQNFAGLSKISFAARTEVDTMILGGGHVFLTSINFGISRLAQPGSYYLHYHEMAHLFLRMVVRRSDRDSAGRRVLLEFLRYSEGLEKQRVAEVWADSIAYHVLFCRTRRRGHAVTFTRFLFSQYSFAHSLGDLDVHERHQALGEFLLRAILILAPLEELEQVEFGPARLLGPDEVERVLRWFFGTEERTGLFEQCKHLLAGEEGHWGGAESDHPVIGYTMDKVRRELPTAARWAWAVANEAKDILEQVDHLVGPHPETANHISRSVRSAYRQRRPVLRTRCEERETYRDYHKNEGCVEPLFVVSELVRSYLRWIHSKLVLPAGRGALIDRSSGDVQWNPGEGEEAPAGLDWFLNDILVRSAGLRREVIGRRVVFLKSVWDISVSLRARRMCLFVEDALTDAEKHADGASARAGSGPARS